MITWEKGERYDGSHRIVGYEPGEDGKLRERARPSDLDEEIATFYEQRRLEMERLRRRVLDGEISPIALCMIYQQMTESDLATRVKLGRRAVRKHLTPEGFRDLTVERLQRYARVFDVAVADFFQFLHVGEGVTLHEERRGERLYQLLSVEVERGESGGDGDHNE